MPSSQKSLVAGRHDALPAQATTPRGLGCRRWLRLSTLACMTQSFVLKSQIEQVGFEKLRRQVTVGLIDFKLW